ncbi:DUF1294 domain-containing protein, partial [Bacillus haynesii]|nr:DUF1294 domain-containing protein [Bacillus haynesii]
MTFIWVYTILINGYGFFLMKADKQKAVRGKWRVSERRIWLVAAAFGSAGVW